MFQKMKGLDQVHINEKWELTFSASESNLHSFKKQNIRNSLIEIKHKKNDWGSFGLRALSQDSPQDVLLGVQCPVLSLSLNGDRTCDFDEISVLGLWSIEW